jgi:CubicO group peptidase (beta-lactamase class C family)
MNDGVYKTSQILTSASIEEMHTIQYQSNTYDFQYGLGFQIWISSSDTIIGHTGGLFGVATKMVFSESENIGIIIFTNKGIENFIDSFSFSMIELFLYQKINCFEKSRLGLNNLFEFIRSNNFLSEVFNIKNQRKELLIT